MSKKHKILKTLYSDQIISTKDSSTVTLEQASMPMKELLSDIGLKENEKGLIEALEITGDISVEWDSPNEEVLIIRQGIAKLHNKEYLHEWRTRNRNRIFDFIKIISTIILLGIAIYSFVINTYKTNQNIDDIQKMENRIKLLEEKK